MNSYTYEFIYEMNIWIHEYMNSFMYIIQMYRFWIHTRIHKYMNSEDMRIYCIQSEFLVHEFDFIEFIIWIHYWKLMKIQYSEFTILNSVVKYGTWIHCNEFKRIIIQIFVMDSWLFIYKLNIYEFTNLISWDNLWFCEKCTQQQLNTINLNTCKAM